MSNEKFTKGPWLNNGRLVYCGADFIASASKTDITDFSEVEANAALIAAAPEMYTELKEVSKGLELLIDNSAVNALYLPALYEQVERIEALLAKARGG